MGVHILAVKITCDPAKREATLRERGLDFLDAVGLFEGDHINVVDDRFDYGEVRYQAVGYLEGRMMMVVWTPRGEARHVISMRKCNDREQKRYRQRLGPG
jgi:uncharacterized DUF497 family protein